MYKFPDNYYSDVRIENVYKSLVRLEMGKLEEVKEKTDMGAFIRLFDGSRWYYASTTDIASINDELRQLAKLAGNASDIEKHAVVKKFETHHECSLNFEKSSVERIKIKDKISLVNSFADLVAKDTDISHWSVMYSDARVEKHFLSSLGSDLKFDTQNAGVRLGFRFGSGSNVFSESWCKALSEFSKLQNLHLEAKSHIEKSRAFFAAAESIDGGDYTVILSPMAAGIFAHESFGHKSEADFMVGDETMKREWQIGKKVGSDVLSIVDDGSIISSGYTPFDDEGTMARKTMLITEGKLTGRLHSATTAGELDESVTGNARATGFEFEPIVRMTTTYIEPGDKTREELFSQVKHGIFIESVKHGSGMSTFTLAPSLAYLIEDGKITRPVKFSVITGNVMKTLDQIDAVSDKLEILSFVGGGCGKMEQFPLPVSFGGPYVRVRQINVQ